MSILKMDYFTVICDNCQNLYTDEHSGFSAWNDESAAMEYATEDMWVEEENKHYCPDCYEYDNEDNFIIKPINQ